MPQDPVEKIVEDALLSARVAYTRGREGGALDFHLTDLGVEIECKRFYTDRIARQIRNRDNVILIQGIDAAHAFADMLAISAEAWKLMLTAHELAKKMSETPELDGEVFYIFPVPALAPLLAELIVKNREIVVTGRIVDTNIAMMMIDGQPFIGCTKPKSLADPDDLAAAEPAGSA